MLPQSRPPARRTRRVAVRLALAAALATAAGCMPITGGALREHAVTPGEPVPLQSTALGRAALPRAAAGESACVLLEEGREAWLHRAALVDAAERSIDLQYYIYERDASGLALIYRALLAADRGVRVRVLLDDGALSADDGALAALDAHRNVEVRVFNAYRNRWRAGRMVELLADFRRLQRRMHNKLLVVDGAAAISGGRNVGDNYFDRHRDTNFEDVDLQVLGPAAAEAAASFEQYWNSAWSVPAASLVAAEPDEPTLLARRARLEQSFLQSAGSEQAYRAQADPVAAAILALEGVTWAPVHFVADPPDKVDPDSESGSPVLDRVAALLTGAEREVLLASAYFVPHKEGARGLGAIAARGVRVAVVTNSLAATDVPVVHAGYLKYRRRLLKWGVELYEYRRRHDAPLPEGGRKRPSSGASLHTKSLVVDGRYAWIGSFNLDPRSAWLNTEVAFVVDSPELAGQLAERIRQNMAPERAWRVIRSRGGLEWHGTVAGRWVLRRTDPNAPAWLRVGIKGLSHLPFVENLL